MARKKPKYNQGIYKPINPHKYSGNVNDIIYRSGLELKYFRYVDLNSSILKWGSETVVVPYISVDGRPHRYFLDLWLKTKCKDGSIKEYICEIKPLAFVNQPKPQKRISKKWKMKYRTWLINQAKWDAATKYAKQKGWEFKILTDKDI